MSEAVALPNAASIVAVDGLQPIDVDTVAVGVTAGGVRSWIQVIVREFVLTFPQLSVAVHVLVSDLEQPVDPTAPSEAVGMSAPSQLSEAVAMPSAP